MTLLDSTGRVLNARGIHLVDWDGFVANPAVTLTLRPPQGIAFPAKATLTASGPRLYFDLPSQVDATGPTKLVTFASPTSTVDVRLGIFPDRDGNDESYELLVTLGGSDPRPEVVPITVHDQDRNLPIVSRILVDFSQDKTGFFQDTMNRQVIEQAADDWSYFLDDMELEPVRVGDETTPIWNPDGFVSTTAVRNAAAYTGFLLYVYGFHSDALRSGGEGSHSGSSQRNAATALTLRRSGGIEVETRGNFNALGWRRDLDPDHWSQSGNLGSEPNDLYSIVHHEMGHAHGFNDAYSQFEAAKGSGLSTRAIFEYYGRPVLIDKHDHFDGVVDPASGFGAFGNEYHGVMPRKRWIITRLDVLALEAMGYKIRGSWETWQDHALECP